MYQEEEIRDIILPAEMQLRIIVIALAMGVAMFAGFTIMQNGLPNLLKLLAPQFSTLEIIALAIAVSDLMMANILPQLITAKQRAPLSNKRDPWQQNAQKLGETYKLNTILAAALLEGPAFLALIAFMLDGSVLGLALALVLLLGILSLFPFPGRMPRWVENQLQLIDDSRGLM